MSIKVGTRVQVPAHWDAWMMGDRYGTIVKIGRRVTVKLDKSGRNVTMTTDTAERGMVD